MRASVGGTGRRWLVPGIVAVLLLAGVIVSLAVSDLAPFVGAGGLLLGLATAAILLIRRSASLGPRERRAWRLIGVALFLMWAGVLAVGGLTALGATVPAFGPLDIFFVGAYVGVIAGLYQMMRIDSGGREWVLTLIDAMVGGIALAALAWSFVFHDLVDSLAGAPWWEVVIAAMYPIGDVVIVVGLLILVMRRANYHMDIRLILLALGVGAQVLADFLYLTRGIGQDFANAEPAWAVNMAATFFLVLTAAIVDRVPRKREFPEAPTPVWVFIWPYVLAVGLVVVHLQNYRDLGPAFDEVMLLDAVILIGVVIILRQVYVLHRDRTRVDEKRAELVASVSHELRTPLTAMVGFLTLLDEHSEEFPVDARREMVSEAADQARHMSRLVSDLLVLARGDSSRLSVQLSEVQAMELIEVVLRSTDLSGVHLEEELDAEVTVRVDPDRLKQALGNLMSNAVRYGRERCLIAARVVDGSDLIVEVHDDGDGVPTKHQTAIWQQFERGAYRLDAATPGLGIGLSIVQGVAEAHGGKADYRASERLGGACFSLRIPGCVVTDEAARTKVSAEN